MGALGTLLIIIGMMQVWREYRTGSLRDYLVSIVSDYQQIVITNVSNEDNRKRINEGFEKIKGFIRDGNTQPFTQAVDKVRNIRPVGPSGQYRNQ